MSPRPFQVLPFTLSELFVLLFFVLALALANETRKRGEVEQDRAALEEAMAPLGVETTRAIAALLVRDTIPDDFQELVRRVAEQERWRPEVERQLREAGHDSARLADAPTEELIRELADASRAETRRLDRENQDLRSRLANLMTRGGTGVDHPPCWADEQGRIEYAFEATIHTAHVDLRAIWPAHRDRDALEIPGMTTAAGQGLDYGEFSRRALPILRWSQRQEPGCRHFVRILDRVDGGKDAFKDGLLTVERYFYKLLVD